MNKTMSFSEAVRSFFSNYSNFSGRARRSEYWWVCLFNFLVGVLFSLMGNIGTVLDIIYSLVILVPGLALCWRRLHDIGKSGCNYLWILLPIVGWIMLIVWSVREGDHGANEYGADPKE